MTARRGGDPPGLGCPSFDRFVFGLIVNRPTRRPIEMPSDDGTGEVRNALRSCEVTTLSTQGISRYVWSLPLCRPLRPNARRKEMSGCQVVYVA